MLKMCGGLLAVIHGVTAFADLPAALATSTTDRDSSDQLEEIVVTARHRAESLMKVPVAITTVSGADLEQKGLTEIFDLGKEVTSINFAGADLRYRSAEWEAPPSTPMQSRRFPQ